MDLCDLDEICDDSMTFCSRCLAWLSDQALSAHKCYLVTYNDQQHYLEEPTLENIARRFGTTLELEWKDQENYVVTSSAFNQEILEHLDTIPPEFWGKPFKAGKRFTKLNKTSPIFLGALLEFFRRLCSMRFFVKHIDLRKVYLCASEFLVDPSGILLTSVAGNWKPYIPLFEGFDKRSVEILELGMDDKFVALEGQIPPTDPCFAICRRLFDQWRKQNQKYIAALAQKKFIGFEVTTKSIIEEFAHTCAIFDGNLTLACENFIKRPEVIAFRDSGGNPELFCKIK